MSRCCPRLVFLPWGRAVLWVISSCAGLLLWRLRLWTWAAWWLFCWLVMGPSRVGSVSVCLLWRLFRRSSVARCLCLGTVLTPSLPAVVWCAGLPEGPYTITSSPTSASSGIPDLVESVIGNEMSATGSSLVPYGGGAALDAAVGGGLGELEGAAAGAMAVGGPATWLGVGAFAAGLGAYVCLSEGCNVQEWVSSSGESYWNRNPSPVINTNTGEGLYYCKGSIGANGTQAVIGPNVQDAAVASAQTLNDFVVPPNSGVSCGTLSTTQASSTLCSGTDSTGKKWSGLSVGCVPDSGVTVPPGGLKGDTFAPPASGTVLQQSDLLPGPGQTATPTNEQPVTSIPTVSYPADSATIADIVNAVRNDAPPMTATDGSGSTFRLSDLPPVTGSDVQVAEQQTGNFPTIQDWFTPVAPNSVVQVNPTTGVNQPSATSAPTLSQQPGGLANDSSLLEKATPCGNILAGETPCSVTIDATYNPETDTWEWQQDPCNPETTVAGTSLAPYTSALTSTQTKVCNDTQNLPDVATGTTSPVDTLTDPGTLTQTLQKTQTSDEVATQTDTGPLPDSIPDIILPWNEWPVVMQDLVASGFPDIDGTCPSVSFTLGTIRDTTFTADAHCLVLDATKPLMAYMMPPIYLVIGLWLLMKA